MGQQRGQSCKASMEHESLPGAGRGPLVGDGVGAMRSRPWNRVPVPLSRQREGDQEVPQHPFSKKSPRSICSHLQYRMTVGLTASQEYGLVPFLQILMKEAGENSGWNYCSRGGCLILSPCAILAPLRGSVHRQPASNRANRKISIRNTGNPPIPQRRGSDPSLPAQGNAFVDLHHLATVRDVLRKQTI